MSRPGETEGQAGAPQQPLRQALIVTHGQPSDPGPAEAELAALAAAVGASLPGWHVGHATLAAPGALAAALAAAGPEIGSTGGLVYPLFMAGGWFTQVHLPARLAEAQAQAAEMRRAATQVATCGQTLGRDEGLIGGQSGGPIPEAGQYGAGQSGAGIAAVPEGAPPLDSVPADTQPPEDRAAGWLVLPPFGTDPAVQDLTLRLAREAEAQGARSLLLAAHGSFRSAAPAEIAFAMAARIAAETGLSRVEAAFIDQEPRLDQTRGFGPDSVCLPFFAAGGGHVRIDLPRALALAGFGGQLLPPVGLDPRAPALIAAALLRGG